MIRVQRFNLQVILWNLIQCQGGYIDSTDYVIRDAISIRAKASSQALIRGYLNLTTPYVYVQVYIRFRDAQYFMKYRSVYLIVSRHIVSNALESQFRATSVRITDLPRRPFCPPDVI